MALLRASFVDLSSAPRRSHRIHLPARDTYCSYHSVSPHTALLWTRRSPCVKADPAFDFSHLRALFGDVLVIVLRQFQDCSQMRATPEELLVAHDSERLEPVAKKKVQAQKGHNPAVNMKSSLLTQNLCWNRSRKRRPARGEKSRGGWRWKSRPEVRLGNSNLLESAFSGYPRKVAADSGAIKVVLGEENRTRYARSWNPAKEERKGCDRAGTRSTGQSAALLSQVLAFSSLPPYRLPNPHRGLILPILVIFNTGSRLSSYLCERSKTGCFVRGNFQSFASSSRSFSSDIVDPAYAFYQVANSYISPRSPNCTRRAGSDTLCRRRCSETSDLPRLLQTTSAPALRTIFARSL